MAIACGLGVPNIDHRRRDPLVSRPMIGPLLVWSNVNPEMLPCKETQSKIPGAATTPRLHKADLHMLAVFMTVAECSGSAAAQVALNVGQSSISRQISELEKRLGMRLCQRGRAGFQLTDKGRIVYEACQHLATALESFRSTVGALRGELVGDLSIAVIDNWASERSYPLADVLQTFRGKARQVHIRFHTLTPDEIERAVLENRANLGIGVFHQHRPGLTYKALLDDPVELYCGKGHALFDRAPHNFDRNDLHEADLVHRAYLSERQVAPLTGTCRQPPQHARSRASRSSSCRAGTSAICPFPTLKGGPRAGACAASCRTRTASTRRSSW